MKSRRCCVLFAPAPRVEPQRSEPRQQHGKAEKARVARGISIVPQPFSRNAPALACAQFGEGHILIGPGAMRADDGAGPSGGRATAGEGAGEAGFRGGAPTSSGRGAPGETPEYESLNALTRRRQPAAAPAVSAPAAMAFQGMGVSADVLTDAMEAVGACLGTPRAASSDSDEDMEDAGAAGEEQ
jgi:hypothetical protein